MSAATQHHQRNQEATCHVSNLDPQVTEDLVWEIFVQCGPVASVFMPKDKVTGSHYGYGFVEFKQASDAVYAHKIMNMVKVFDSPMRVSRSSVDRVVDVGANLFVGNLDPMVDDKLLYDTFSSFGTVLKASVKAGAGPAASKSNFDASGGSSCIGFVTYDSFEASDLAVQCMNGQFLCNRQIRVQYALKKGSKTERHGSQAERLLAAEMQAKRGKSTFTNDKFSLRNPSEAASGQQIPPQSNATNGFLPMQYTMPPPPMPAPPPLPAYQAWGQAQQPHHHQQQQQPQGYYGAPQFPMPPPSYSPQGMMPMGRAPPLMPAPPPLPQQYMSVPTYGGNGQRGRGGGGRRSPAHQNNNNRNNNRGGRGYQQAPRAPAPPPMPRPPAPPPPPPSS